MDVVRYKFGTLFGSVSVWAIKFFVALQYRANTLPLNCVTVGRLAVARVSLCVFLRRVRVRE